jgi:hypothetical protein
LFWPYKRPDQKEEKKPQTERDQRKKKQRKDRTETEKTKTHRAGNEQTTKEKKTRQRQRRKCSFSQQPQALHHHHLRLQATTPGTPSFLPSFCISKLLNSVKVILIDFALYSARVN